MRLLGLDVETTGLDDEENEIIELGMVLWDWEKKKPLVMRNHLIKPSVPIPEEITDITGITDEDMAFAEPREAVQSSYCQLLKMAEYQVAHNAPFDRGFMANSFLTRTIVDSKEFIDTRTDIPFDHKKHKAKNLVTLAATHGFLNPFAHRALFDVLTMMRVMSKYPIDKILERQKSPTLQIIADVSFAEKDKAKEAGFHWDPDKKHWHTKIKELDMKEVCQDWHFKWSQSLA